MKLRKAVESILAGMDITQPVEDSGVGTTSGCSLRLVDAVDLRDTAQPQLNAAFETGIANPLEAAIVAADESSGLTTLGYRKIDEIPHDFLRKRLTIVAAADIDAAQHMLKSCSQRNFQVVQSIRSVDQCKLPGQHHG
jgi:magnesium-transporting ATPase (P-type)